MTSPSFRTLPKQTDPKDVYDYSHYNDHLGLQSQITALQQTTGLQALGTWTPALLFGGASVGITYTSRQGAYVKQGKLLWVNFQINLSSKGSSVGNAIIGGLPFQFFNNWGVGSLNFYSNMVGITPPIYAELSNTGGGIFKLWLQGATTVTQATDVIFTNTSNVYGSGVVRLD
jgi:hypothetical protein